MKYVLDGKRIKNLRSQKGWNQARLAKEVGFEGPTSIGRIENGSRPVTYETLYKLALVLEAEPNSLIKGEFDDSPVFQRSRSDTQVDTSSYDDLFRNLSALEQRLSGLEHIVKEKPIVRVDDGLSEEEREFINLFRASSEPQRKAALAAAKAILNETL